MYFLTIVLAVIFIICALAVEEAGLAAFLVILSVIMIVLSAILIYRDYKKSKNITYKPQFFDNDTPTTVDKSGYGYSMDNPIYTSSVHNAYVYLDNLKTPNGKKIKYKRSGAFYGVVCNGKQETAVDEYEITVSGKVYATLFICPYGKDSNRIPNGFLGSTEGTKTSTEKAAPAKTTSNGPSHEQKVTALYKSMNSNMVGTAFPGGKNQVGSVIKSLSKIFKLNLNTCDVNVYKDILSTYTDVLIRKVVTHSSDDMILASLKVKHPNLIKDDDTANMVMSFVMMNMMNNDFEIKTEEDLQTVGFLADGLEENEESREENEVHQTENLDDADYGLVPEKPIYTKGVAGSNSYLERLTTTLGEKLSWERQGSMSVEGINGMIDIYEGYLPSGKRYKTLYVNMYGTADSTTAPKGFKINNF